MVTPHIQGEVAGTMGTGSNFFRCGVAHSNGNVYLGTYGPQPAIVWKCNPRSGDLRKIGTPGEYQLDCMVEAPNGMVYIGTAYSGLVYRLDPATDEIVSIGSPDVESTPWIFTMVRTRTERIYGAKGVGLFRLDWQTDRTEALGVVPGDHTSCSRPSSAPIIRQLVEAEDGTLYGDTNRHLFSYAPDSGKIEVLVDMADFDRNSYALFLPCAFAASPDLYFAAFCRFAGNAVKHSLYVFRTREKRMEPLPIRGLSGRVVGHPDWWGTGASARLLVPTWHDDEQALRLTVVDPCERQVVEQWSVDGNCTSLRMLVGGSFFIGLSRGLLLQARPGERRLCAVVENPEPVECRCLAISPRGVLGTDTYDCGYAFTLDPATGARRDHGQVWSDDHRCNYGPAAFAGADGRFFVANHSEGSQALWVTDTVRNRHWRIGGAAVQLVPFRDGSVWGTTGPNPPVCRFDPAECWTPAWSAQPGNLFRYVPGAPEVRVVETVGEAGPMAEAPGGGRVLLATGAGIAFLDPETEEMAHAMALPSKVVAASHDAARTAVYLLLEDETLHVCREEADGFNVSRIAVSFGPAERGFFVLPRSGKVVALSGVGSATIFDPPSGDILKVPGPEPLPAGPAVHPVEDAWFFADKHVVRYALEASSVN